MSQTPAADAAVATALIAEDEPVLADALARELAQAWPQLRVVAQVGDGESAVREALALRPDLLFFDIRMPGLGGLEAAAELADAWPTGTGAPPFPALVFVTAYDQYAVRAFEAQALDYLVKPVRPDRLARTVARVQSHLAQRRQAGSDPQAALASALAPLRALLGAATAPAADRLQVIQASAGSGIRMVPLAQVVYFEAADKYVRVLTEDQELLIRTPLKELLAQLDGARFWQIHRGTVVRADAIDRVERDDAGRQWVGLRGRPERLLVSRLWAHRFKPM